MTKRQRLRSLEGRIGQLTAHILPRIECPIRVVSDHTIERMPESKLDAVIAKRLTWLRENNEKERMGRRRY